MVQCQVVGEHWLSNEQYNMLESSGKATKMSWWLKNMDTSSFVNYNTMIGGKRIPGNQKVEIGLDLPEASYMMGVGDWNTEAGGRHCSQTFYFYVDESGAHNCAKSELPINNNGMKPVESVKDTTTNSVNSAQTFSPWRNKSQNTLKVEEEFIPEPQQPVPLEMVLPKICFCWNDMETVDADFSCDCLDMIDQAGEMCCMNCAHSDVVYVRKR